MDVRMLRVQDAQEQRLYMDVRMLRAQDAQEQRLYMDVRMRRFGIPGGGPQAQDAQVQRQL